SGDIGLIMARRMQLEGASVLGVAEIMPYSNGLNRNIVQCLNDFKIPLFLSHTVTEVESDCNNKLKSITIQKVDQNFLPIKETEKIFNVDTLLLSIGLIPDITLLDNLKVDFDTRTKSVKVNQAYETSIEGLFICGNSLQVHDLVDNVSKESLRAGKAAANYLNNLVEKRQVINVIPGKNTLFTTPQMIDFGWVNQELVLNFRVQKKIDKAKIKVYQGEEVIFEKIKTFLAPAEMETLSFDYKNLHKNKDLLLEVEDISL
ncbi:MAG: FAD-dependent oxidoreductase, partial [Candidatus Izemoplasmatales bacterium]|nr:FAD-dependent oxidoreductase [Candidatus Izemoplasmatales bacterium]